LLRAGAPVQASRRRHMNRKMLVLRSHLIVALADKTVRRVPE
jgi:hypothetical protein